MTEVNTSNSVSANSHLLTWQGPGGFPDFSKIDINDFLPAIDAYFEQMRRGVDAISQQETAPTFDNTLLALELLNLKQDDPVAAFYLLADNHTSPALQALEIEVSDRCSAFSTWYKGHQGLFSRLDRLYQQSPQSDLTAEEKRLLEKVWLDFTKNGVALDDVQRRELGKINQRLGALSAQFGQNVLASEANFSFLLRQSDLEGLPSGLTDAMAALAKSRGHGEGAYTLSLSRSFVEPFLTYSKRRDLRETVLRAFCDRGTLATGETDKMGGDNRPLIAEILRLRAQKAHLLGYDSFATYRLDKTTMAKAPSAVMALLEPVWEKALSKAKREETEIKQRIAKDGQNHDLEAWDWRFYQEKVRAEAYDFDESQVKPYLQLEAMIEAAFDTARRLFGLDFREQDLSVLNGSLHHEDARLFQVLNGQGEVMAFFCTDYFSRPSKRSGAWMSNLKPQHKLMQKGDTAEGLPLITNTMNFVKPAKGTPALLSFDDARTLFHEFGHALHGMLSNVTFPSLSGTAVSRDFVELPSQLYEHWLSEPSLLQTYARHKDTGEGMPQDLLNKMLRASRFDAGFATCEFTACALVDMAMHALKPEDCEGLDPMALQATVLEKYALPKAIPMRHAAPHFLHLFDGEGYAAGYYAYMWSEVLDADAFQAFKEVGDPFHAKTATALGKHIYSSGNSRDPEESFIAFRGKLPSTAAMIEKKGLNA